jgi:hypothetical protein
MQMNSNARPGGSKGNKNAFKRSRCGAVILGWVVRVFGMRRDGNEGIACISAAGQSWGARPIT